MTEISNRDKAACAEREVKQRVRVYERLVADGRMSAEKAQYEIEVMTAIAADYRALADKEEPSLFGEPLP